MDGVVVDLKNHIESWFSSHPHLVTKYEKYPDHIPGIFRDPKPIEGSIETILQLYELKKFELYVATSAPWGNPESLSDKRYWLEKYFGDVFHKRLITTHRKDLLIGDYLIDDREKNGALQFRGKLLSFGTCWETGKINEFPDWESIYNYLTNEI